LGYTELVATKIVGVTFTRHLKIWKQNRGWGGAIETPSADACLVFSTFWTSEGWASSSPALLPWRSL